MMKVIIGLVIVVAVAVGFVVMRDQSGSKEEGTGAQAKPAAEGTAPAGLADAAAKEAAKRKNAPIKEFTMTSFYDDKGAWFSMKEIKVKQGDLVRIRVTNTKGMHDFVLDEFNIKMETPLDQEVVIEFVADKTGSFEYYCSKPGHRARGQWGKLIVE